MADNKFRLFRLPFLALCRILNFYGPCDIIQLSLCSKRSLRVVKQCWKETGKVEAYLYSQRIPVVTLYFHRSETFYGFYILEGFLCQQRQHNIRIGDSVVPSFYNDAETSTFWEDTIFGVEHIVSYIKDLFDTPITRIHLKYKDNDNEFIDTMDCIMKIQESVQNCSLDTDGRIDECLTHLLNNCKITGVLTIYGELSSQFKNDWNIHLNGLHLRNGLCFTFQNLTNISCQFLDLDNSSLTCEDLNQFLKHWQNGGSARIRYASIRTISMNPDIITSGIETVTQPATLRRFYPFLRKGTIIRTGGLDIQRNDGTTGTVYLTDNSFGFGVYPTEVIGDRENF